MELTLSINGSLAEGGKVSSLFSQQKEEASSAQFFFSSSSPTDSTVYPLLCLSRAVLRAKLHFGPVQPASAFSLLSLFLSVCPLCRTSVVRSKLVWLLSSQGSFIIVNLSSVVIEESYREKSVRPIRSKQSSNKKKKLTCLLHKNGNIYVWGFYHGTTLSMAHARCLTPNVLKRLKSLSSEINTVPTLGEERQRTKIRPCLSDRGQKPGLKQV